MKNQEWSVKQRATLALLTLGYAGYYVCRTNLSVSKGLLLADTGVHGITTNSLGMMDSYGTAAYAAGKFLNGVNSDFLGGKRTFVFGMVAAIACTLVFGLGGTLGIFLFAWTMNRFVQSMGWPSLVKITSRWFGYDSYARAMAILSLSFLLGNWVVKQYLGFLISHGATWRGVFLVAAGTLAVIAILNAVLLRAAPDQSDEADIETVVNPHNVFGAAGEESRPSGVWSVLKPFLASKAFWIICVLSFGYTLLRDTFNNWLPLYFEQVGNYSHGAAASYSSYFDLFGAISVLLCGFLSDRVTRGRRGPIMLVGLALATPVLLALGRAHKGEGALILAASAAAGFLLLGPYTFLAGALSLDIGGKRGSATAAGLIDGVGYVGGTYAGEGIASKLTESGWGSAFESLALVAVISAVAAVVYWLTVELAPATRRPAPL